MDKRLEAKLSSLRKKIRKLDSALVAFSGGVDSTFLTRICREELGEKAVAVTTLSGTYPRSELSLARRIARIVGVKHMVVDTHEEPESSGSVNVCRGANVYSCLKSMAMRMKVNNVLDGSHVDDAREKGESFLAARHAGVKSPLLECDLSKAEIRLLAKELGLPNWDKPASSGTSKLEAAEKYLLNLSKAAKIRFQGDSVTIIAGKSSIGTLAKKLEIIEKKLKSLGFSDVVLKLAS